ncbi:DUF4326 domain-containing protein [Candidatus Magnetaquicoccus inordinatus]|uniref:DUF4326 domain-containing protein n=1 Tax=Candidatus Magnetaquicoccus inordinatus TaxID=2496818 RepID=UPI00102BF735|nr:DUF4326 domain-containing protein [Candidatus Magnetaquicoccus inordinatus]
MNSVLILYPPEFNCYSKFSRKVAHILLNLDDFMVVFPHDPNLLIKKYFSEVQNVPFAQKVWQPAEVSHAIIFDDKTVFANDVARLREAGVVLRQIVVKITRAINIKIETDYKNLTRTPEYEYIGRGSYWGNPYAMYAEGESREEVIRKYEYDFTYDKFPNKNKSEVYKLAGKRLGCFCKPKACHGDVLANFLNSWDDGT